MKPEKRHLVLDLLDDGQDARRTATLQAGGRILRRRRLRREFVRGFAVAAILGIAAFSIRKTLPSSWVQPPLAAAPAASDQPRAISDAELLALFPNTPVALARLENGKKRLIFPRLGDEERFVTKL